MSVDITLPRITGTTPEEQLVQIRSYLFQMAEQLRFALNNLDADSLSATGRAQLIREAAEASSSAELESQYNQLKALIINTADAVKAFSEEITLQLEKEYVAQSEFGDFKETAIGKIEATADNLTQYYYKKEEVDSNIDKAVVPFDKWITETNAYIRSGEIASSGGVPVYGVEIGQKTKRIVNGHEEWVVSDLVSRFTSDRLSFYQGEAEVAYISNQRLYITDAQILGKMTLGNWQITTTNGFALNYVG